MADIIVSGKRSKKGNPRVDMTPMVDLGFLLITFFMLTTTLSKPKTMNLIMPKDDKDHPNKIAESKSLTVILEGDHKVAWYEGIGNAPTHPPMVQYTTFANKDGIRDVIIKKRLQVMDNNNGANDLTVLIKADKSASYQDVVGMMDEMLINHVDRYALVDMMPEEQQYLKK
jgi:biopolymer transport protein ExbD